MVMIFVYGTLKSGEPNSNLMKDERSGLCKRLGTAYTKEKFPLVVASRYNIPFLLYKPGTGHNVEGELFEVDDVQLERLDKLENHPNLYVRKDVIVSQHIDDANSDDIQAQSYFLVNFRPNLTDLPMLVCYNDMKDGKEYVKHSARDIKGSHFYYEVHTDYQKDK